MLQRKVLIVTYHFPPSAASGSFRLLGFARHLPRAGWQPVVVAPPQMPGEPVDPGLVEALPPDALVRPVPYPSRAPRLLRRLAPQAVWLPRAWRACRAAVRAHQPAAVLTSGPPHWVHLLGLSLRRSFGLPWVADFRDPWLTGARGAPGGWRARWLRYWERRVMASADVLIANAPNVCRMFQEAYPAAAPRFVSLTNGFDPIDNLPPVPPAGDGIRLVHAGELYHGRDPLPLLEAMAGWNRQGSGPRMRLEVIGRSYLPVNLAQEIGRRGLDGDVAMTGQLPYREALAAMARASILVLFDTPGRTCGVPAKLYEYLGAGRPILALAEPGGDTALVLRDSGVRHRLVSPRDAGQIRQALGELVRESTCQRPPVADAPGSPVDAQRLRRYTREYLAGELGAILDRLTGSSVTLARVATPGGGAAGTGESRPAGARSEPAACD